MGQTASPEHISSAKAAGLRYVTDGTPGVRRRRNGRGFAYFHSDGTSVRERDMIRRFRSLAIPPAWTDVWICPDPDGHLQVTARDARGRKQYRYHPSFRARRDETKFERLFALGDVFWKIRERVERDVTLPGVPREKVMATLVWLLERTLIRIGTRELARENKSYGLTTLRRRHVEINGSGLLRFEFRGKSGKVHTVSITDKRIARIVQRCHDLRGQELFQYLDDEGKRQDVEAEHVNDYLREITGADVTAKDFRTWAGTMIAAELLRAMGPARTIRQAEENVVRAIDETAARLGNTRAICRKYYIHPLLIQAYMRGDVLAPSAKRGARSRRRGAKLRRHEVEVLAFLKSRSSLRAA